MQRQKKHPVLFMTTMFAIISIFIAVPALAETAPIPNSANQATHAFIEKNKQTKKTKKTKKIATEPASHSATPHIQGPSTLPVTGVQYLPVDFDVPGQSFVSSGPYLGIPLEYSGSNLIVNNPNINEDVTLLKLRKNITQRLESYGRPAEAKGSHILLSGMIEAQALAENGSVNHQTTDINVTSTKIDAYILGPSTWTSGLIELGYDNNIGTQSGSFSSNNRTQNSRVFVNQAFVVLGDLLQSPFYATVGQLFVPFGVYSTTLVSDPLTKILGRTKERAIIVGYQQQQQQNHFYASTYIFKGASHASVADKINNGGVNAGYGFKMNNVNADIGVGVIGNIADSQGMQYTGNQPLFAGFGGPTVTTAMTSATTAFITSVNTGNEQLVHRVPAYDAHALLGIGNNLQFIGEYITASTDFSPNDLTYNSHGARPQALNIEGVYNLPWFSKPTSVSLAYGMSQNALGIGLPAKRYSFVVNRSWWKDTLQSLEFRRDVNYGASSTSSGSNQPGPTGSRRAVNMVTLQFDYYF